MPLGALGPGEGPLSAKRVRTPHYVVLNKLPLNDTSCSQGRYITALCAISCCIAHICKCYIYVNRGRAWIYIRGEV